MEKSTRIYKGKVQLELKNGGTIVMIGSNDQIRGKKEDKLLPNSAKTNAE